MKRILSAAVLGGFAIYLVAAGPRSLGALAIAVTALIAAHEMAGLMEAAGFPIARTPAVIASCLMLAGAWRGGVTGLSAGLALGLALVFTSSLAVGQVQGSLGRVSGAGSLLLVPVWSLSHLMFYLDSDAARRALLFLLLCVWVCDSAAFYVGSAVGRRKLAPLISPNKTVAGSVGGTLGAAAAAVALRLFYVVPWPMLFVVGAGVGIAILAQLGDLAESMLKRDAGVKDSGSLIPGHGGILDRLDALLFAVSVFYYFLAFYGGSG